MKRYSLISSHGHYYGLEVTFYAIRDNFSDRRTTFLYFIREIDAFTLFNATLQHFPNRKGESAESQANTLEELKYSVPWLFV